MLLNHGANVNIRPEDHGTALQVAPGCGHNKIIQMLPEGQVELNSKSRRYENALSEKKSLGKPTSGKLHFKIIKVLWHPCSDHAMARLNH
ncbi:hypothetical protein N7526_010991 [Penicillium atrosanguineum]|nr:hypothetical protein N7526_010991 [Penicillium atrosanguineum]